MKDKKCFGRFPP